ncbi:MULTISPECIES: DUF3999 family protein [unclassified Sphingomonas]|uniref:DUF3999 family protein n=1 Tax=unclassified Sphingomonas TaxID=196159 RepID=UPI0006F947A0|nr:MULTISPECIES: DUF3999 family protein [unclassified Sphingomonas]KQX21557.1 hypothetical protein ASD17_06270 [Sphingomonas sp. Root1294]KQY72874.1 hypothetical protein ASD39_00255 [Sphingomonas sp. Root50]KRB88333.1 hypothetical protein ASE22_23185 [Sphingomonas sp. Root720]
MTRWMTAAACALLAGCSAQDGADPADPSAYAVRLAVTPAPGGSVQRIDLPAAALAALRSPTRADVRIFDGAGTPLAMAIAGPAAGRAAIDTLRLPAFPIVGPAGALAAEGTELRVEQRDGDRIVTVVRGPASAARAVTLGALFDTRAIVGRARSLRLDAVLPPQQPVSFVVETSPDLADWTPVGGKILYRREAGRAGAIGSEAIPLDDIGLEGRYLRVTWTSPQRLLAPVELRGALVDVARRLDTDDRPAIATSAPRRLEAHDVRFTLPRPMLLAAVTIAPAAGEMLVPVTLFGRNAPDQSWTPIGSGSLRAGATAPIELSGAIYRDYRIEADRRTPGFAAAPRLKLLFEPARLAVLFDGKPPYTLAAGVAGAESRYLAMGELVPGYRPGAEDRLPQATVAAPPSSPLALAQADDRPFSPRKTLLWGLLLLGVAALGLMVWRLWRPAKAG